MEVAASVQGQAARPDDDKRLPALPLPSAQLSPSRSPSLSAQGPAAVSQPVWRCGVAQPAPPRRRCGGATTTAWWCSEGRPVLSPATPRRQPSCPKPPTGRSVSARCLGRRTPGAPEECLSPMGRRAARRCQGLFVWQDPSRACRRPPPGGAPPRRAPGQGGHGPRRRLVWTRPFRARWMERIQLSEDAGLQALQALRRPRPAGLLCQQDGGRRFYCNTLRLRLVLWGARVRTWGAFRVAQPGSAQASFCPCSTPDFGEFVSLSLRCMYPACLPASQPAATWCVVVLVRPRDKARPGLCERAIPDSIRDLRGRAGQRRRRYSLFGECQLVAPRAAFRRPPAAVPWR